MKGRFYVREESRIKRDVLVHVCADLFRVLAHASAWEVMSVSSMFRNKLREIGQWLC